MRYTEFQESELKCTKDDPCGYCKKCKERGTLKVTEGNADAEAARVAQDMIDGGMAAISDQNFNKLYDEYMERYRQGWGWPDSFREEVRAAYKAILKAIDDHEAWQEKTAAKRQGRHYHENVNETVDGTTYRRQPSAFDNFGKNTSKSKGMQLGMDRNGNSIITLRPKGYRGFSIQTNGNLPKTHSNAQHGELDVDESYREVKEFLRRYGTGHQNKMLAQWEQDWQPTGGPQADLFDSSGDQYDDMEWGNGEMMDEPQEDDGFIQDNTRGGYDASVEGKFIGNFGDVDEAYLAIKSEAGPNWFPNVWFVDDHGGIELFNEQLDKKEVDTFHTDLDDLVHQHLGHSSDEVEETRVDSAGNWDFQPGDEVHLGFGHRGGAGYFGTIKSIDGDEVIITNDKGRMFKGPVRYMTPVEETQDELMASRRPRGKAQQRIRNQHLDVKADIAEDLDFSMDEFCLAYCEAMLWAETDDQGVPLEDNYDIDNFDPAALQQIKKDCAEFQAKANLDEIQIGSTTDSSSIETRAGHDFWLTRAGHGAGFWDGDWPVPHGDRLTNLATSFGNIDVYVGDEGNLHLM
jgi:hypothetical protein